MCMGCDSATDRSNSEVDHRREEGGGGEAVDGQETTTMAPPVWPPPAEVEEENEEDAASEETDVDTHLGYLQISDEPGSQTIEVDPAGVAARVGSSPVVNDGSTIARSNGGHTGFLAGAVVSNGRHLQERVVTVNGMEFHVFGNVSGLELLGNNSSIREDENLDMPDSDEEEEEERSRAAVERAIAEAYEADEARRHAPIPPEHRARILDAMRGINLRGF